MRGFPLMPFRVATSAWPSTVGVQRVSERVVQACFPAPWTLLHRVCHSATGLPRNRSPHTAGVALPPNCCSGRPARRRGALRPHCARRAPASSGPRERIRESVRVIPCCLACVSPLAPPWDVWGLHYDGPRTQSDHPRPDRTQTNTHGKDSTRPAQLVDKANLLLNLSPLQKSSVPSQGFFGCTDSGNKTAARRSSPERCAGRPGKAREPDPEPPRLVLSQRPLGTPHPCTGAPSPSR